ncbi:MAG: polyamine ABC transporter substrate-binding protein [Pseudomonadota bacterium]
MRLTTLTAILALGTSTALANEVRVYNWSDYIDEDILAEFTAETGIEVVYDVFDSNEVLETKLLAGGTGYDLVVPTGTFLQRQIQAGVFQPLDKSKLSNLGNMWDEIAARTDRYDPEGVYSINYMWGTTGIGYNVDKVKEILGEDAPVGSLSLIFDPANAEALSACGIHVLDAPEEMIPMALAYLGMDPTAQDKDSLDAAGEALKAVRPHIQKFHSSEYINALANGDICVATGWSGDVLQARDRAAEADNGVSVEYTIPAEGALMWFDQMAIPSDAKNVENAHAFLDYLMRAEVAAKASNYVYYANGNKASQPLLAEDVIGDTAIYPDEATVSNLYTVNPPEARTQRTITRLWTSVKTGQ